MHAHARIRAVVDRRGHTRLAELRSAPPIALRDTRDGVHLVGAAAGPLGGDELLLEVVVEAGATLTVRSAGAALALTGDGGPSHWRVRAEVAERAALTWLPEPLISAQGSVHHADVRITLAPDAALWWREEVVLGRSGQERGAYRGRLMVDRGGPLLRHELRLDAPGADGAAVLDGARAVGLLLRCGAADGDGDGPSRTTTVLLGPGGALMPLAPGAALATVLAADALELRRELERAALLLRESAAA